MKTAVRIIRILRVPLSILVVGVPLVTESMAQLAVPYVPEYVQISPRTNGGVLSVEVSVDLPSTCESVGTWGQPVLVGNRLLVDAQFWSRPLICLPVLIGVSTQYNLGSLLPGSYDFVFKVWGNTVETKLVTVPMPVPESGLYQITSGSYVSCCGISGSPLERVLPTAQQTFVELSVDAQKNLARLDFLSADMRTRFAERDLTFSLSNGVIGADRGTIP